MAWVTGDAEKILKILGLGISETNLDLISACMDKLALLSPASQTDVQAILADYATADAALSALNTSGTGKTLVQADVLKWEVDKGNGYTYSPATEMQRLASEIIRYFGPCMGIEVYAGLGGVTALVRS